MNSSRPYSSPVRAERAAATRQRILDAARELVTDRTRDFTLEQVASAAGVSVQTVLRGFGNREQLIVEAIGTFRDSVAPVAIEPFASVEAAVTALFDDYEEIGDRVIRLLAEEHRVAGFADVAERGREMHRRWVQAGFAPQLARRRGRVRSEVETAVVAATDVYVWHLLRRDLGLDRPAAEATVARLVRGALSSEANRPA
ncbi:MAG: TetR/AcrR family transcriptional regulator [Acidimicrobiales bacterium]